MNDEYQIIRNTENSSLTLTANASVPAIIENAGADAKKRFVEFFTANIRNPGTREAYLRAVRNFCCWCDEKGAALSQVEPVLVAAYIELLAQQYSTATVKQHLAAIRMLFDYLVTGGVIHNNPAASVKGPRLVRRRGKTPVLAAEDARKLLDSLDTTQISGLRDRALIGLMIYTFARVSAVLAMDGRDIYESRSRMIIRLHEKGGRYHQMPLHHHAEDYLREYLKAAEINLNENTPIFRTLNRRRQLTTCRLQRENAWRMVKRKAAQAGVTTTINNHTFRATGITEYMRNGGTLEKAQKMAAHASSRTTSLYNRVKDEVTLAEVERVRI